MFLRSPPLGAGCPVTWNEELGFGKFGYAPVSGLHISILYRDELFDGDHPVIRDGSEQLKIATVDAHSSLLRSERAVGVVHHDRGRCPAGVSAIGSHAQGRVGDEWRVAAILVDCGYGTPPCPGSEMEDRLVAVHADKGEPCRDSASQSGAAESSTTAGIPSGRWHGHYIQKLLWERRQDMTIGLNVHGSFIQGLGVEADGWFSMDGCYDPQSRRVLIVKHHVAGVTAVYHGYYDGARIQGYWELPNKAIGHTGEFVLVSGITPPGFSEGRRLPTLQRPCPHCGASLSFLPEVDVTCHACGAGFNAITLVHGGSRSWNLSCPDRRAGTLRGMVNKAMSVALCRQRAQDVAPIMNHSATPLPCRGCGYDLRGLPGRHRCPECGIEYDHASYWLFAGGRPHGVLWYTPEACVLLAIVTSLTGVLAGAYGILTKRFGLLEQAVEMLLAGMAVLAVGAMINGILLKRFRRTRDRAGHGSQGHSVIVDENGVVVSGGGATETRIAWQSISRAEYSPARNQLTILGMRGEVLVKHTFARTDSMDCIRLQECALEISRIAHLGRAQS